MSLFTACGVRIKANPLLPLLFIVCALTGSLMRLLLAFMSLAVHEAAHTALSSALGYRVREIELLPFGFVARLNEMPRDIWDELTIASAGPAVSLLTAVTLAQLASRVQNGGILYELSSINAAIAAVNLVPAVPLDGGRMLRALLGRALPARAAAGTAAVISFIMSAAAICVGVIMLIRGAANITLIVFGVFLLAGAYGEYRRRDGAGLTASVGRREKISSGEAVPVRQIAVSEDATCREVLRHFRSSRLTVLMVADADMRIVAQLTEADIVDRIARLGPDARIYTGR